MQRQLLFIFQRKRSRNDIIKKVSTRYEFPDGTKAFEKNIYKEPEKYFTEDIMKQIDEAAKKEFMYGDVTPESSVDE